MTIKVNEIFYSIQGESTEAGRPCIFIRLTGCKLRCSYCDTKYAYHEGEMMDISSVLTHIRRFPCTLVEVTGGEPLEQKDTIELLQALLAAKYEVMLETDGIEDISHVPAGVKIIFDVKTPGSKMMSPKTEKNLLNLRPGDEIKFVIVDEADYEFSRDLIRKHDLESRPYELLLSPVMPQKDLSWLPGRIITDGLKARFQLQLHKIIWGDKRGV